VQPGDLLGSNIHQSSKYMESNLSGTGLTAEQVIVSRRLHGNNGLDMGKEPIFFELIKDIVLEPMFILLLMACVIYFIVGQQREGFIMLVSIFIVAGISIFQEYRSKQAVSALKKISAAKASVFRDGIVIQIPVADIVQDDLLLLEEGEIIAADGLTVQANDFSVNESILTGEAFAIHKNAVLRDPVYKGTLVTSGSASILVGAVGANTEFGKIGLSLTKVKAIKTPLQVQIRSFVLYMMWIGLAAFLLVIGFNYYHTGNLIQSFLQGLTLAMSILPEEIPVAFSTFQALGALRLLRNNIIVKHPQYVETLGSATVICVDKTGTLTQNRMTIECFYDAITGATISMNDNQPAPADLLEYAMWSSESNPFDPMEKAIHELYGLQCKIDKRPLFTQVHEYPISGKPPMMTHIFRNDKGEVIIAAKGGTEGILRQSNLQPDEIKKVEATALKFAQMGFRVLGVGSGIWSGPEWPGSQETFKFNFLGLIAFLDPPKENIVETIRAFGKAGITVKMITGDYAETAVAIAGQVGLVNKGRVITGQEVMACNDDELAPLIQEVNIFARMFPEAKLRIIEQLKQQGAIVAMTGDGVNDAPALKAAHISIAMGHRGSEVAKSTSSLIITDDDLSHMVEAVALGRKIYDNLKKAIQYIVSIHIPIILIVTLPLLLGWKLTGLFSPVHVIFLELIMGPTCSIIYENEPIEPGTMLRPPRKMGSTFLSISQLGISLLQGLFITAGCLGIGYYSIYNNMPETYTRTLVFITLLICNILLTLLNRSFKHSIIKTIRYKNNSVLLMIGITILFIAGLLYVPGIRTLFGLEFLPAKSVLVCLIIGIVSTGWIEVYKIFRHS
jgi:Ca2+-transporting ATPase